MMMELTALREQVATLTKADSATSGGKPGGLAEKDQLDALTKRVLSGDKSAAQERDALVQAMAMRALNM
jgi:hypothetical protein